MTITLTREEAQQVLDLMTRYRTETPLGHQPHMISHKADEAIETLRARLSAPEPEPVAWTTDIEFDDDTEIIPSKIKGKIGTAEMDIPLYAAPPQRNGWQELSEYDVDKIVKAASGKESAVYLAEAKLKDKNT